jgi:hypothetical protein
MIIKKKGLYFYEARKNPEMNPKISAYEALKKYKDDPDIYVSFTDLNKIGIKPLSGFNTPNGIYTYPLKEIWKEYRIDQKKSVGKVVPFAGDREYIQVIRLKNKKGFVEDMYRDYTSKDYDRDIKKLESIFEKDIKKPEEFILNIENIIIDELSKYEDLFYRISTFFKGIKVIFKDNDDIYENITFLLNALNDLIKNQPDKYQGKNIFPKFKRKIDKLKKEIYKNLNIVLINQFEEKANELSYIHSPIGHFWYITYELSKTKDTDKILGKHSNTQKWNNLLRKLGYTGFADKSGRGLIHISEPIQAFFLQKDVIEHVETVLNKDYSGDSDFEKSMRDMSNIKKEKDVSNFKDEYDKDLEPHANYIVEFKYKNKFDVKIKLVWSGKLYIFLDDDHIFLESDAFNKANKKFILQFINEYIKKEK